MRGRESSDWVRLRGTHLDLGFLVGLWWVCERGLVVKSGGVGGGIGVGLGLCLFMIGREVNLNEYDNESMQMQLVAYFYFTLGLYCGLQPAALSRLVNGMV